MNQHTQTDRPLIEETHAALDVSVEVGSERPVEGVWLDLLSIDRKGNGPYSASYLFPAKLAQAMAERTVMALARAGELDLPSILAAAREGGKS